MAPMAIDEGKGFAKLIKSIPSQRNAFSITQFEDKLKDLGIDSADIGLDSEDAGYEEDVSWIPPEVPQSAQSIDLNVLLSWRKIGPLTTSIEEEVVFVDSKVLKELFACKKAFHEMDESIYQGARARSNAFERIGKGPFICRAAMKMANLDSVLGFSLTEPKTQSGNPVVGPNDLFFFADVCAGPGGFTEYILWKKGWEAKGFGLTLRGELDFKLADFVAAEPESFEPYYGPADDGNIYKPENVTGYLNYVLGVTDGKGVHLMMADGGFSVAKQENNQEILSGQIILSQCLVAIGVVRTGGHFVCKLFDIVTPFSIGLIYLMYLSFDLVSIHKPNTSRPANSERYLICKWKREGTDAVMKYLKDSHHLLWELSKDAQKQSILEVVPVPLLTKANHPFFKYIWESNNSIGKTQIQALKKMIPYIRDPTLENEKQTETKMKSFELWGVPHEISLSPSVNTITMCKEILESTGSAYPITLIKHAEKDLTPNILETSFRSPYDWRFVVVEATRGDNNRGFYLSLGRNMVYRYDGFSWLYVTENIELSRKTLVYGEVVEEIHGKKPSQNVVTAFHIIDAIMVGGHDIRSLHYTQRHEYCVKFAKAMSKNVYGLLPVRVKNPVRMENIADVIDKLEHRVVIKAGVGAKLVCPIDHTDETCPVIQPAGLLFIKITKDPWQMALNRTANRKYWFNKVTGKVSNGVHEGAIADFFWTMQNRFTWWWDKETNVILSSIEATDPRIHQLNPNKVHAFSLSNHVQVALRTAPQMTASPEKVGGPRRIGE